jgi:6-phosphogluconate dehydrogenase
MGGPFFSAFHREPEMHDTSEIVSKAVEGIKLELLAEAYCVLKSAIRISHDEMRTVFSDWNRGELADPLVAASADVLGLRDEDGDPLLEKVLDVSRGPELCRGAAALALELGVPAPLASQSAVSSFRSSRSRKDERVDASALLSGPKAALTGERHSMIDELRKALHAAFILAYTEAYSLLAASGADTAASLAALSEEGSSVAQAAAAACERLGPKEPLILDAAIKSQLDRSLASLRRICARSAEGGLYVPVLAAALSYYDGIRSTWLPSNLVAALRDSREGTLYERVDRPRGETFHSEWK